MKINRRFWVVGLGIVAVATAGGLWWWKASGGVVHPASVPMGFPSDTTLFKGREVQLPGKLPGVSSADRNLLQRALDAHKTGEGARGTDMIEEILRRAPALAEARYFAALWRYEKRTAKDTATADTMVQKGLSLDPGHPWLLLLHAKRLTSQSKLKEAHETLTRAIDFAPTFREGIEELAAIELKLGNLLRAQRLSQLSISLAEKGQRRYDLLAEILLTRERDDSALEAVKLGLQHTPNEPRYFWIRGLLAESRGDTASARKDYVSALSGGRLPQAEDALRTLGLKPLHGPARTGTGIGGISTKQTGFAVELLTPLTRTYPRSAPLHFALGRALQEQGYLAQAGESFKRALDIDSTVPGLVEWTRENRKLLEEKAKVFAKSHGDSAVAAGLGDTRWYDLGHYRIAWGVSQEQFIAQFGPGRFQKPAPNVLAERRTMWGIEHFHGSRFDSSGLWAIQAVLRDAGKASIDLLEEGIRLNALQAGSGTFNETKMCPPWGQVESVWWETTDTYEFMAVQSSSAKRLGLIRVQKERVPEGGICALVAMAMDTTLQ
ncbi:MAG: hypothetical protein IPN71_05225 [Fibrobacteres bacterium]|jgi:tetratricopeptide (TPR) repeat protein|nr:hypothetical protein [Fibrobacterota bacterium]